MNFGYCIFLLFSLGVACLFGLEVARGNIVEYKNLRKRIREEWERNEKEATSRKF